MFVSVFFGPLAQCGLDMQLLHTGDERWSAHGTEICTPVMMFGYQHGEAVTECLQLMMDHILYLYTVKDENTDGFLFVTFSC